MRQLPKPRDAKLLVGSATADDAGVYRLDRDRALVLTADFFTPIVDDPRTYGRIAAAHSMADVYAMGGRPLAALNLVGFPDDQLPAAAVTAILKGADAMARKAGCVIVGGHTIRNPEPVYGLAVAGLVSPQHLLSNTKARPGHWLVLTKPLGTGIIATALKKGLASPGLVRRFTRVMLHLNQVGAELAERKLVTAATDVSGFGLLGHLLTLCQASEVGAEIWAERVPLIGPEVSRLIAQNCVPGGTKANLEAASANVEWAPDTVAYQMVLADAQTGGGLLLCVPPRHLAQVLRLVKKDRAPSAAVIGRIRRSPKARILVRNE